TQRRRAFRLRLYSAAFRPTVERSTRERGEPMALVLQVILVGVAAGGVYGIAAIGYATLYRLTGVVHFALGELVSLALFTTLFIVGGTGPVSRTGAASWRFIVALLAGAVLSLLFGVVIYLVAVRPFLRRGSL